MLGKITGNIVHIENDSLLIDNNGLGYIVFCPSNVIEDSHIGTEITLYLDSKIQDEQIKLIGFKKPYEKQTYKILTSVQGVGSKMALAILGLLTPEDINIAITAGDKTIFTRVSGVGNKLASRIINELQNKKGLTIADNNQSVNTDTRLMDATNALVNLGFNRSNIHAVLARILSEDKDITLKQLIKNGLASMSN